jgi:ABC-2 type transport system permease protein
MDKTLKSLREELEELQEKSADGKLPRDLLQSKQIEFQTKEKALQRSLDVKRAKLGRERDRNIREIQRKQNQEVTAIQNRVKAAAVALPCIPPLIVGVIVFASRRLRERENISKSRLK